MPQYWCFKCGIEIDPHTTSVLNFMNEDFCSSRCALDWAGEKIESLSAHSLDCWRIQEDLKELSQKFEKITDQTK